MGKINLPRPNLKIEDLKPGDVLLFPPNSILNGGWVGQAIVLLTGGKVSHSAVLWGEKDGVLRVAHAAPPGITSESFIALLKAEPGCYVKRNTTKKVLEPVLTVVDRYTDHENPYPFFNLGILGLLLLANRFSEKTIQNSIFYKFALLVSLKIMQIVEKNKHPNKHPMSCSQFVAQCFTDAGNDYEIKFNKLLIQFGVLNSTDEKNSLLNMVASEELEMGELEMGELTIDDEISKLDAESVLSQEDQIASEFLELLENGTTDTLELVKTEKLGATGKKLLKALCKMMTGKQPSSVEDAIKLLSTNRNYYVTPEDLLSNAKNLVDIGYLDKSVLDTHFRPDLNSVVRES